MRLTVKTAVAGLGVVIAVLVTGAVAFYALESSHAIERAARSSAMAMAVGNAAHARLEEAGSGLAKFVATGDERFAAAYAQGRDEFLKAIAEAERAERAQAPEGEGEGEELAGYAAAFRTWLAAVAEPALQARRHQPPNLVNTAQGAYVALMVAVRAAGRPCAVPLPGDGGRWRERFASFHDIADTLSRKNPTEPERGRWQAIHDLAISYADSNPRPSVTVAFTREDVILCSLENEVRIAGERMRAADERVVDLVFAALIDDRLVSVHDGLVSYVRQESVEYAERIAESDRILGFARLLLLGPGVLVLLSHGLAALVVVRMVRSVRAMQTGAGAIRDGDLTVRIPVERSDELGELAQAMNSMVERLEQGEERTKMMDEFKLLLAGCSKAEDAHVVAAQFTKRAFPDWAGAIYLLDATRLHAQAVCAWGGIPEGDVIEATSCWALKVGRAHDVHDMATGVPCHHLGEPKPSWSVCVPMVSGDEVIGFFHVACPAGAERSVSVSGVQVAEAMAEQLARTLADLRMRHALREQAILDPLTALFNRRYLSVTLERAILRSRRSKEPIGVMVLDIDHFKRINDSFGHAAGDAVLVALSKVIKTSARGEDIPCRYGGEEFLLVMVGASRHDTLMRAEQLRKTIAALALEHDGAPLGQMTVSVGVAAFPDDGDNPEAVIRAADLALYAAKHQGRNRVVLAPLP